MIWHSDLSLFYYYPCPSYPLLRKARMIPHTSNEIWTLVQSGIFYELEKKYLHR